MIDFIRQHSDDYDDAIAEQFVRLVDKLADSDDVAQAFRDDAAHHNDMMPPIIPSDVARVRCLAGR